MTDLNTYLACHESHRKDVACASELNKPILFDALAAADITSVTVEFDGEGDSGQIESVIASTEAGPAELQDSTVTLHRATWNSNALASSVMSLRDAIERICYDYLEYEHGGWENNDGAFGSFDFDVGKRSIHLDFNGRFSDYTNHTHDL
jgi:hypothetical protein